MLAVIFRAAIAEMDDDYHAMAERLRELALEEYGCREFCAWTEGDSEVAISYWENEEQIRAWRADAEHIAAQDLGRDRWYKGYSVQVVEILREYKHP